MNIALFTDTYPPFINGVSTSCFNLCKTLKAHGHNVVVIAPRTTDGPYEFKDGVIWVPGIKMKKIYGYRITTLYSRKVMKFLKKFKPDVIHNQCDFTIGQFARIAASILKIPYIYTYHTNIEDYTYYAFKTGLMNRIAKRLSRLYSKLSNNETSELITPSYKTMQYMRNTGSDILINIVPTGIDFSLFETKIDDNKVEEFKKNHHIHKDTKVFLLLGRVAKEKSMDISIKAFAKYHRLHFSKDIRMLVVGDGPNLSDLKKLTNKLGISTLVDFIGSVPSNEVAFYYRLADIYTSASVTETQGLTFLEALAAQNMVLARFDDNLTGTIVDGENGFFFTDENSFIEKVDFIFNMSEEDKIKIQKNIKESIEKYSLDKFYYNIIDVYKNAVKKYW